MAARSECDGPTKHAHPLLPQGFRGSLDALLACTGCCKKPFCLSIGAQQSQVVRRRRMLHAWCLRVHSSFNSALLTAGDSGVG